MVKRVLNPQQRDLARGLRRQRTSAERILWNSLGNLQLEGTKFRRQHPIGDYIVDFVNLESKLIIEIDGGQHDEAAIQEKDEKRTKGSEMVKVIRCCDFGITIY